MQGYTVRSRRLFVGGVYESGAVMEDGCGLRSGMGHSSFCIESFHFSLLTAVSLATLCSYVSLHSASGLSTIVLCLALRMSGWQKIGHGKCHIADQVRLLNRRPKAS